VQSASSLSPECECFVVLVLNTRRRVKGHYLVSVGTQDTILVHPREVFRLAIMTAAVQIRQLAPFLIACAEIIYTCRPGHWSGKGAALPPPPPLRTGRETFASSGSSRFKAPRERSRCHDVAPLRYALAAFSRGVHTGASQSVPGMLLCQRMHTWISPRSFALPLTKVLQVLS
jgi:hypothetical protein